MNFPRRFKFKLGQQDFTAVVGSGGIDTIVVSPYPAKPELVEDAFFIGRAIARLVHEGVDVGALTGEIVATGDGVSVSVDQAAGKGKQVKMLIEEISNLIAPWDITEEM